MVCLLQRCVVDAGLLDGLFIERFRRCLRRVRTGFGIEITRSADWLQLHRASEKTETRGEANPAQAWHDMRSWLFDYPESAAPRTKVHGALHRERNYGMRVAGKGWVE